MQLFTLQATMLKVKHIIKHDHGYVRALMSSLADTKQAPEKCVFVLSNTIANYFFVKCFERSFNNLVVNAMLVITLVETRPANFGHLRVFV